MSDKVSYMPDDSPGTWKDDGKLESEPETHTDLGGLTSYTTADVRDSDGDLHEDVTIVPPDKD
jgi:hypothetical protein